MFLGEKGNHSSESKSFTNSTELDHRTVRKSQRISIYDNILIRCPTIAMCKRCLLSTIPKAGESSSNSRIKYSIRFPSDIKRHTKHVPRIRIEHSPAGLIDRIQPIPRDKTGISSLKVGKIFRYIGKLPRHIPRSVDPNSKPGSERIELKILHREYACLSE